MTIEESLNALLDRLGLSTSKAQLVAAAARLVKRTDTALYAGEQPDFLAVHIAEYIYRFIVTPCDDIFFELQILPNSNFPKGVVDVHEAFQDLSDAFMRQHLTELLSPGPVSPENLDNLLLLVLFRYKVCLCCDLFFPASILSGVRERWARCRERVGDAGKAAQPNIEEELVHFFVICEKATSF